MCKKLGFENQQKQAKSPSFYTSSPRASNVLSQRCLPLSKNPHPCQSNPDTARWMSSGPRGLTPPGPQLWRQPRRPLPPFKARSRGPHRPATQDGRAHPPRTRTGRHRIDAGEEGHLHGIAARLWERASPGQSPQALAAMGHLSPVPALRSEAKAQEDQAGPSSDITQLEGRG